jgi:hypothetical protein
VTTRFGVVESHDLERPRDLLAHPIAQREAQADEPRRALNPAPLRAATRLAGVALDGLNEPQRSFAGFDGSAETWSRATPPARA